MRTILVNYFLIASFFFGTNAFLLAQISSPIEAEIQAIENGLTRGLHVEGQPKETFNILERMEYYRVPGFSVAIVKDGKIHWAKAYGHAEAGEKRKVDTETLFQACSVSKPVSALAILKLVQEGKLDLDRNVNDYLKSWKLEENEFTEREKVTIRRLLSHTAGLNVHGFPGYQQAERFPTTIEILEGRGHNQPVEVVVEPGTEWRYSGGGYVILQQLLEEITGRSFDDYMNNEILAPMGMSSSTYQQPIDAKKHTNIATAHRSNGAAINGKWHNYAEKSPGGLWTTPTDLARYCMYVQRTMAGAEYGIFEKETFEKMLTKHLHSFGLGPMVEGKGESLRFRHDGSNAGFKADFLAFVNRGDAVVVLSNGDNGGALGEEFTRSVSAYYGWDTHNQRIISPKNVKESELRKYVGRYSWDQRPYYIVTVELVDGSLRFIAPDDDGDTVLSLTCFDSHQFIDVERDVDISFDVEGKENVTGLLWSGRYQCTKLDD